MKNLVLAAVVALFAFAVNAAPEKAAPAAASAAKQLNKEECDRAMAECKNDEACKEKLRNESNCK